VIRVHLKSPASIGTTKEAFSYGRVYFELMNVLEKRDDILMVDSARHADMQVCWCQPYQEWDYRPWYRREHDVQVIYTTFECTSIPRGWDDEINKMAACFTTSNFCVEHFKKNGIEVPLHLIPHGVNPDKFAFVERFPAKPIHVAGVHPSDRRACNSCIMLSKNLIYLMLGSLKSGIRYFAPLISPANASASRNMAVFPPDDCKLMSMCHISESITR
jgi:hypothetical protein